MTEDLVPVPDGALSWKISGDGKKWVFTIDPAFKDDSGLGVSATDWVQCLENYRVGKPESLLASAFPNWKGTKVLGADQVVLELSQPDPYLAQNLSLVKFFRLKGESAVCAEPVEKSEFIASGMFRQKGPWNSNPRTQLWIESREGKPIDIEIRFVSDDQSRTLQLLSGQVDFLQNGVSLSKTNWIKATKSDLFGIIEREGVNVSYLAFNLKDPLLKNREVRQALAYAIDRAPIVHYKMQDLAEVATGFLSPALPEYPGPQTAISFDPLKAETLLDQAGFPRKGNDRMRLSVHYRTTSVREGYEMGMMLKDQWKKIGVDLIIDVVEPALFLSAIQKGKFQLFSSRWVGVSDGSVYHRSLRSGQNRNRVGYSSPEADVLLDRMIQEPDLKKRILLIDQVEKKMLSDLPYFPLLFWKNALIYRKGRVSPERLGKISLSGAIEPIFRNLLFR